MLAKCSATWLSGNTRHLGDLLILVRTVSEDRQLLEIMRWGRRRRIPFEAPRAPRVAPGDPPILQRQRQVDENDHESKEQQGGTCGGCDMQGLKPLRVIVVAPGHSHISEQKLRDEGGVEP